MGFFDTAKHWLGLKSTTPVNNGGGWTNIGTTMVNEPFMGAWQRNQELKTTDLFSYHAVFACVTLISGDVGKLRFHPKRLKDGVLTITKSKATRIFKKPNNLQTWQQFAEQWINSKTKRGNTYVWKHRDIFGDVYQLHVLNPDRVKPLVADNGDVFYQIARDKLFNLDTDTVMPASEIIHDRFNCLYHPLVGLSPITACAISAAQGIAIQNNQTVLFKNGSRPDGVLSVPAAISGDKAKEIKAQWQATHSGVNQGGVAVLGDGAKYEIISISADDAQLIDQLKLTGEIVCSVFHVPPFKVGIGSIPTGTKIEDLNEIYYSDCLQHYIESIENLLDAHLELEDGVETEADLKSLIRMDSTSKIDYLTKGTQGGIIAPNEARAELGYAPVMGGDTPLMQQQNYSLEALAKRDAKDDPFSKDLSAPAQTAEDTAKTVIHNHYQPPNTPETPHDTAKSATKPEFDDLYKGKFDADVAYAKGDFVSKKGGLWVATAASKGDFSHENWKLVSKNGGEQ